MWLLLAVRWELGVGGGRSDRSRPLEVVSRPNTQPISTQQSVHVHVHVRVRVCVKVDNFI